MSCIPHANDGMMEQGNEQTNPTTTVGLAPYQQKCHVLKNKPENSTAGKQSTDCFES